MAARPAGSPIAHRRIGAQMVSRQQAHRLRQRGMAGPRALGRPGGAQEERESSKMTARVWTRAPSPTSITSSTIASPISSRSPSTAARPPPSRGFRASGSRGRGRRVFVRCFPGRARGRVLRERRSQRHRKELRHHSAAHLRLQTAEEHFGEQQGGRRIAALQPGRQTPRLYTAAHPQVLRRPRTADDLRPRRRNHPGRHRDWDRSVDGLNWEADSRSLLGAIDDAGTRRIYRLNADGGKPVPVTVNRRTGRWRCRRTARAWSPSGRAIESRPRWCRWRMWRGDQDLRIQRHRDGGPRLRPL